MTTSLVETIGLALLTCWVSATAAGEACAASEPASGPGCVATHGPFSTTDRSSCSYVAAGAGRYAAFTYDDMAFDIYVDGQPIASGWNSGMVSDVIPSQPGETVTVILDTSVQGYFRPFLAMGSVVAADVPSQGTCP